MTFSIFFSISSFAGPTPTFVDTDFREKFPPLQGKLRRSVFYDAPFLNDAVAFPARPHLEKHGAHESSQGFTPHTAMTNWRPPNVENGEVQGL